MSQQVDPSLLFPAYNVLILLRDQAPAAGLSARALPPEDFYEV